RRYTVGTLDIYFHRASDKEERNIGALLIHRWAQILIHRLHRFLYTQMMKAQIACYWVGVKMLESIQILNLNL
ncbi:MAG: hypothetical protein JSV97_11835, partial [candidate division WOR-3 bacterium]